MKRFLITALVLLSGLASADTIRGEASVVYILAVDTSTDPWSKKTGDAANLTAHIDKDGGGSTPLTDVTATEVDATDQPGLYWFDLSASETAADVMAISCISVTADIVCQDAEIRTKDLTDEVVTDSDSRTASKADVSALATSSALATAQGDLDIITDTDGVILGAAGVDLVWDEELTGGTHNVPTSSGRRLRSIQDFGIYDMASVWVDEEAGTSTGTLDGEDATVTNRADDFDNAQTIATSVGLDAIHVQNGNSITLTATINNFNVWSGAIAGSDGWTIALGGQDIGRTTFAGATVTGVGTGVGVCFLNCRIDTATLPPTRTLLSSFIGTITVGSAGNFQWINCQSGVAGTSAPIVDLGAGIGATTMEFRRWSGGLTLNNVQAGDVVSVDVVSGGTITINGSGGDVVVRGIVDAVVDGSGGAVTVTNSATLNQGELATALTDYDGPTNTEMLAAHTTTDALINALNDPNVATIVAGILAGFVDGTLSLDTAMLNIHAALINTSPAPSDSGTIITETFRNFANTADVGTRATTKATAARTSGF